MEWFKKSKPALDGENRKDLPDGLWIKCSDCGEILYVLELKKHFMVCKYCGFHFRLNSPDYAAMLLDDGSYEEYDANLLPEDPLEFKDSKRYPDRVKTAQQKSGLREGLMKWLRMKK